MTLTDPAPPIVSEPDFLTKLKGWSPEDRAAYFRSLTQPQRARLKELLDERERNPYLSFRDNPVGFVTDPAGLGEVAWSLQRQIMLSVRDNKRTAVPACHAPGKSHIAARIIAWWGSVHPAGTARILTTATTFRQVKNVLWPYIRSVHAAHGLPGEMNMVEWYIDTGKNRELVAEGVKAPDEDETALSGLHAPHILIVIDEGGGISHAYGRGLIGLLTGAHTRLLVLGNPPIDEEGSWFEVQCASPLYNVIPIGWERTPNYTKEYVGYCMSHPGEEPHLVNDHLIDASYVKELEDEYGPGSAVVEARVHARFPKSNEAKTLPIMWLERAMPLRLQTFDDSGVDVDPIAYAAGIATAVTPLDPDDSEHRYEPGLITMGADIAGGTSDELTIACIDNGWATMKYAGISADHRDPQVVVGKVAYWARWAAGQHRARGITKKVRFKIDPLGLGWNIWGQLRAMTDRSSSLYDAELAQWVEFVEIDAGKPARQSDRFTATRSEMWWTMRKAIEPDEHGKQAIVLDVDRRTIAQLNAPKFTIDGTGHIQVESKKDMLKRGIKSPDRADAVLMAWYERDSVLEIPAVAPIIIDGSGGVQQYRATAADAPGLRDRPSPGFVVL